MRILLFDCESFPNEGWTWGTWDQKVIEVIKARMICSIAWQWYPNREKNVIALPDFPGYDPKVRNNRALISTFNRELQKADIAVGHNIEDFDNPMVNTDILKNDLKAPPPYRLIDTLKILRKKFRLNSNKLNDACQELKIGAKVKHPGFDLWKGCMTGDKKSWALMKKYNMADVDPLLRGLYEKVRPWIPNHPNLSVDSSRPVCPSCGHPVLKAWSWVYTQARSYQRMFCLGCHSWCKKIPMKKGRFVYRP